MLNAIYKILFVSTLLISSILFANDNESNQLNFSGMLKDLRGDTKENQDYVNEVLGKKIDLIPQHWINFHRITFVDKLSKERLTIDLNLTFSNKLKSGSFEDVVIAEIKQDRHATSSNFTRIAKKKHILPIRLSKYCMSTISLHPGVKQNRFKKKVLFMNKLKSK